MAVIAGWFIGWSVLLSFLRCDDFPYECTQELQGKGCIQPLSIS